MLGKIVLAKSNENSIEAGIVTKPYIGIGYDWWVEIHFIFNGEEKTSLIPFHSYELFTMEELIDLMDNLKTKMVAEMEFERAAIIREKRDKIRKIKKSEIKNLTSLLNCV